jgi:carbon monoxide dehydrogenase subunit G
VEGVTKEEMEEKIYECEVKLGIPFLRRSKSTQGTATLAEVRQKIDE